VATKAIGLSPTTTTAKKLVDAPKRLHYLTEEDHVVSVQNIPRAGDVRGPDDRSCVMPIEFGGGRRITRAGRSSRRQTITNSRRKHYTVERKRFDGSIVRGKKPRTPKKSGRRDNKQRSAHKTTDSDNARPGDTGSR